MEGGVDSLSRVDGIRGSRLGDILVATPVVLTRVERPDRDEDGIRTRVCLSNSAMAKGRGARLTFIDQSRPHRSIKSR